MDTDTSTTKKRKTTTDGVANEKREVEVITISSDDDEVVQPIVSGMKKKKPKLSALNDVVGSPNVNGNQTTIRGAHTSHQNHVPALFTPHNTTPLLPRAPPGVSAAMNGIGEAHRRPSITNTRTDGPGPSPYSNPLINSLNGSHTFKTDEKPAIGRCDSRIFSGSYRASTTTDKTMKLEEFKAPLLAAQATLDNFEPPKPSRRQLKFLELSAHCDKYVLSRLENTLKSFPLARLEGQDVKTQIKMLIRDSVPSITRTIKIEVEDVEEMEPLEEGKEEEDEEDEEEEPIPDREPDYEKKEVKPVPVREWTVTLDNPTVTQKAMDSATESLEEMEVDEEDKENCLYQSIPRKRLRGPSVRYEKGEEEEDEENDEEGEMEEQEPGAGAKPKRKPIETVEPIEPVESMEPIEREEAELIFVPFKRSYPKTPIGLERMPFLGSLEEKEPNTMLYEDESRMVRPYSSVTEMENETKEEQQERREMEKQMEKEYKAMIAKTARALVEKERNMKNRKYQKIEPPTATPSSGKRLGRANSNGTGAYVVNRKKVKMVCQFSELNPCKSRRW